MIENRTNFIFQVLKEAFKILIVSGRAFFLAITQVAWGIASLFFLSLTMFYLRDNYGTELPILPPIFYQIISFLFDKLMWFVMIFLLFNIWIDYKEMSKKNE